MHPCPDADCVASYQVVKYILKKHNEGLNFHLLTDEPIKIPFPEHLQPTDKVIKNAEIPEDSTVYIIDHSDKHFSLLKDWGHPNIKEIFVIDHHYDETNDFPITKKLINDNARSCCEVLYDHILANNLVKITKDIATLIYIGIFSDSLYFQTPINEALILKLADLIKKYGAEVDKHHLYLRGKYFLFKKRMGEVLFLNSSKLKTSNTVTVKINCVLLERLRTNWIVIKHIMAEMLNTRGVNHVLIKYETFPGQWNLCIGSNVFKSIEGFINKPQKAQQHYYYYLTEQEVKDLSKVLQTKLKKYDQNPGKQDWFSLVSDIDPKQAQKIFEDFKDED